MGRKPNWPPSIHQHRRDNIDCVTIHGRCCPLGPIGSEESKREYSRLIAEVAAAGAATHHRQQEAFVAELVAAYLDHIQSDATEYSRACKALEPVARLYGDKTIGQFGPIALTTCRANLVAPDRSRAYINRLVSVIRACWRWGVAREMVTVSQWEALKTIEPLREGELSYETEDVVPVDLAIVEATMPFLPPRIAAMVRLQMLTGARPSEICRIRGVEISREGVIREARGKLIHLGEFGVWVYSPVDHKNRSKGKSRNLIVGPQAQAILLPWLEGRPPEAYLFSPREATEERFADMRSKRKTAVQPSQESRAKKVPRRKPGEFYQASSYYHAIQKACEKAGVPPWFPYQLRHVVATDLREEQDLEVSQAVLGHDDPETTLRYAMRAYRKAAEVIARLG